MINSLQMEIFDKPINIGTVVRVNCYEGVIKSIITELNFDVSNFIKRMSLMNPLYIVETDTNKKIGWNIKKARQVYIPVNNIKSGAKCTMKLFRDEFEVL